MRRSFDPRSGFFLVFAFILSSASAPSLLAQNLPEAFAPVLSPPPETYAESVTVDLTSSMPEATEHCTIDGSIPTSASPICTSLTFVVTTALKAITVAPGYADSRQVSGLYVVERSDPSPTTPTISFNFPTADRPVYASVPVLVRVLPSDHIDSVFLSADGELVDKMNGTGFGYYNQSWDTTPLPAGRNTLKAS